MKKINTNEIRESLNNLSAGDEILLSGVAYTSRDAAHKRILEDIKNGITPPFPLEDAVIYYAGPTPTPPGEICGSFGPTTSARMDSFTPFLHSLGVVATIGKGDRASSVTEAIKKYGGVYLVAIGGAGALCAERICELEEIAYFDLGCESVKKIVFKDFPLIVAIDSKGNSVYDRLK